MVYRSQRLDARIARGLKLAALQLAPVVRKHREIDALQADGRLIEIDQRHAGNCLKDVEIAVTRDT